MYKFILPVKIKIFFTYNTFMVIKKQNTGQHIIVHNQQEKKFQKEVKLESNYTFCSEYYSTLSL